MSGTIGHKKRLICVTAGNIRNNSLPIGGHTDFFPADCFGKSSAKNGIGKPIVLEIDGYSETVETDIPTAKSGKPRAFFRRRDWVAEFYARHKMRPGDIIAIERIRARRYHVGPFDGKTHRESERPTILPFQSNGDGPTVIELFAGCGGMVLGFKRAGFQTIVANEWDRHACDSIRTNITDRVLHCAIQEIDRFPTADVVAGGPPCQGFSNLGDRVPNDPRNQLWRQYMRCVEEARPKIFVLENVPPLLKSAEYEELVRIATKLGYRVAGRVLNAADFGVPQTRKRAIVIGSRIGEPTFPSPTHADPARRSVFNHHLPRWQTVRDAVGHMPIEPTGENWHIGRNPTDISMRRYRTIPAGGNRFDLPRTLTPGCWIRKTSGGTDLFGRLWWDRPSVTIRTEFYKPEKGRYLHPVAHRPITHREAALLQGFPEEFEFCGPKIKVGIQIGNAVPPPLAEVIARHVRGLLASGPVALRGFDERDPVRLAN